MASGEEAKLASPKDVFSNMSAEAGKQACNKLLVPLSPIFVFQESASRPTEFFVPETNAVFYGSNHFNLVNTTAQRETSTLQAFLASLTSTDASLLSHLSLSFPALEAAQGRPETLGLGQDGMHTLKLLQDYCVNLNTLELYVHSGNAFGLVGEVPSHSHSLHEALSQVTSQLRAFSSLKKIVIRYYYDRATLEATQLMQRLGWIVLMGDKEVPQ
ncbi:hypothetical protein DER45DRAFT_592504 [Fusarium avenaceum]|nr:hypothetical protein DER45DRAFT_592504 [Fusarium avenaceum]